MANKTLAGTRIQLRRDTAANWTTKNPVLLSGEAGYDTTNNIIKIGNGATAWNSLSEAHSKSGVAEGRYGPSGSTYTKNLIIPAIEVNSQGHVCNANKLNINCGSMLVWQGEATFAELINFERNAIYCVELYGKKYNSSEMDTKRLLATVMLSTPPLIAVGDEVDGEDVISNARVNVYCVNTDGKPTYITAEVQLCHRTEDGVLYASLSFYDLQGLPTPYNGLNIGRIWRI